MTHIEYGVLIATTPHTIVETSDCREDAEQLAARVERAGDEAEIVYREIGDWKPLGKDAPR